MADWPKTPILTADMYEVGIAVEGCRQSDPEQRALQRRALKTLLDDLGDDADDWTLMPHIREHHNCEGPAQVGVLDYGRKYDARDWPCSWAAYGVFNGEQGVLPQHYVAEGQRLAPETHPLP